MMHSLSRKSKRPTSFRTYVDIEFEERGIDVPDEVEEDEVEPTLLPGEIEIAKANNVLKFAPLKTNKTGVSGTLFVTNFKISFVTSLPVDKKELELHERSLQSHIFGVHDVCLSEVDLVYQIFEGSTKKKRLYVNAPLPTRTSGLQLVLKNFRVINYSFKFTPGGEDIRLAQALLHHAFPTTIDKYFLTTSQTTPSSGIPEFNLAQDWEKELQRTRCPNWRVSKHNESFNLCSSLPNVCVVPRDLLDGQLEAAAQHFQGMRPPVWCWGTQAGAALVRMAQISPSIQDKAQENRMMGLVHRCHPKKLQPTIYDLDQILPSHRELQVAFSKLRDLHTPDDASQYREQDCKYLSRWDSSKWLSYVSKCLETAQKSAVSMLHHNSSVILQDAEGRDMSTVISSLVQILLDPWYRTLRGFHMLLQKEWVSLGHPFTKRLGHTRNDPEDQCPVWLLFLDCVFQISIQHPLALEFTSEYLVALWGAAHCSLHSTFMFNSVNAKLSAIYVLQRENPQEAVSLSSVWSWWATEASAGRARTEITQATEENGQGNNGVELRNQNGEKQTTNCGNTREAFLNVHYISQLIESLLVGGALERVSDPMSSAHHTWLRLCYLMEDGGSQLPYDTTAHQATLKLDNTLRVDASISGLVPWGECFSRWLTEPALLPMAASKSSPCNSSHTNAQLWQHIYYMYDTLKLICQPQGFVNGDVK